jgi:uncharacterized glyoxalase superfamily protein PhnB
MSSESSAPIDNRDRSKPESFRGRELTASITATDLQKSLAWYRDVVGFHVQREHERDGKVVAVSLVAGEVRLVLGQDDGAKGWDRKKGEGMSLMISTAQDVDELAKAIVERGGKLETEPTDMPWGSRVFRVADPDGFKLAIASEA